MTIRDITKSIHVKHDTEWNIYIWCGIFRKLHLFFVAIYVFRDVMTVLCFI